MLKEFRFSNFASFRDEAVLSMEAVGLKDMEYVPRMEGSDKLLPLAAIYGKNGGGKSNILWAFWTAVSIILNSSDFRAQNQIPVQPFRLDDKASKMSTSFDFEYKIDGIKYFYGFSATREEIVSEYLYYVPKTRKNLIFSRDENQQFHFVREKKKRNAIRELVAKNQLFISVAAIRNDTDCIAAMKWFQERLFDGGDYEDHREQLMTNADNAEMIHSISEYVASCDIGIDRIEVEKREVVMETNARRLLKTLSDTSAESTMSSELRTAMKGMLEVLAQEEGMETGNEYSAIALHMVENAQGERKYFRIPVDAESEGTLRLIAIVPAIVRVLNCGGILTIDEMENELHSELVRMLLSKFQNPTSNPNNAQIIFTSHDTELLDMSLLRKDQIYLTDKDRKTGVSTLYSVSDFSTPTRENVHRAYLAGKYGAFPDIEIEEVEP